MARSNEQSTSLPWLTVLLACACVVASWQSLAESAGHADRVRRQLNEAVAYLHAHPYLEVSHALRGRVVGAELDQLRKAHSEARRGGGNAPVLGVELRGQQRRLDDLVAKATQQLDELPSRRLGVNPTRWRPDTLFTYALVHSSLVHLGGGIALLLLLGLYLEPALGATRLAGIVTLATLGAAAGFVFTQPELDRVLIGSSGMLAGLLSVFLADFSSSRKAGFYSLVALCGVGWLLAPPVVGSAISFDHPGASLTGLAIPEFAPAWVYLGGVTGGLAAYGVIWLLGAQPKARKAIGHAAQTSTGSADLDAALELRSTGRDEAALKLLLALRQREPDSIDAALLLGDVAASLGQRELAQDSRLRAVRLESKLGDGTGAVQRWLDLTQREIPAGVEPAFLIRMAGLLRQKDHSRAAAVALRTALERAEGSSLMMVVAGRVARAAKGIDPEIAYDAAWAALGCIELPLAERQALEGLLAQVIPELPPEDAEVSKGWQRAGDRPAPIAVESSLRSVDVVHAVPIDLDDEGLHVATKGGLKKRIRFERIQAVGVAVVKQITEKPVLVVDLILNWTAPSHESLKVIRLRGDRFNPLELVDAENALEAHRRIALTVLERAEAVPLPGRDSVLGRPYTAYANLASYAANVLMAEEPLSENPS